MLHGTPNSRKSKTRKLIFSDFPPSSRQPIGQKVFYLKIILISERDQNQIKGRRSQKEAQIPFRIQTNSKIIREKRKSIR